MRRNGSCLDPKFKSLLWATKLEFPQACSKGPMVIGHIVPSNCLRGPWDWLANGSFCVSFLSINSIPPEGFLELIVVWFSPLSPPPAFYVYKMGLENYLQQTCLRVFLSFQLTELQILWPRKVWSLSNSRGLSLRVCGILICIALMLIVITSENLPNVNVMHNLHRSLLG